MRDFLLNKLYSLFGLSLIIMPCFISLCLYHYNASDPSLNNIVDALVINKMGALGACCADIAIQYNGIWQSLIFMGIMTKLGVNIFYHQQSIRALRLLTTGFIAIHIITAIVAIVMKQLQGTQPWLGIITNLFSYSIDYIFVNNHHPYLQNLLLAMVLIIGVTGLLWSLNLIWGNIYKKAYRIVGYIVNASVWLWVQLKKNSKIIMKVMKISVGYLIETVIRRIKYAMWEQKSKQEVTIKDRISKEVKRVIEQSAKEANNIKTRQNKEEEGKEVMLNSNNDKLKPLYTEDDEVYALPDCELLTDDDNKDIKTFISSVDVEKNITELSQVLEDFGIKGKIIKVNPGPVLTVYEFTPDPGIRVNRVISLSDDIARHMKAISTRITFIPGSESLGIEIPNMKRKSVFLKTLLQDKQYTNNQSSLPLVLGLDVSGEIVIKDLSKMPHLMVAGTTGSGKSVGINAMILSLLYRMRPDECKFIMIDPKMLELSIYEGIPHLLTPVVTDVVKAIMALKWAVAEMEDRYRVMSHVGVRNIDGYNEKITATKRQGKTLTRSVQVGFDNESGQPIFEEQELSMTILPYIVIIVDETADLMMTARKEAEFCLQRLAQMARAAGIHLIMATQRPSVDVITGTIKANFPTRISFQVASKMDSRTILNGEGAEKLLGRGDMLYVNGGMRSFRIHGPFVQDDDINDVVQFIKAQGEPEYVDINIDNAVSIDGGGGGTSNKGGDGGNKDEALFNQAIDIVRRDRKASISYIQRQLRIGYNRAADIVEQMEKEGVISAPNHVGKREVLIQAINDAS